MIPPPITTRSKVTASSRSMVSARVTPPSYPDHLKARHVVVAGIPRDEWDAMGDRGGGDPGFVERQLAPGGAELLPELGPGLVHQPIDRKQPQRLRVQQRIQSKGPRLRAVGGQDAE